MITGTVNASHEATIRFAVRGPNGQEQEVEGIIDTGFTGFLTLNTSHLSALELTWLGREQGILADGSVHLFDVYRATLIWDGQPRVVAVTATDFEPLIGMGMLHGHELRIQVVENGAVAIEALG